MAMNSCLRSDGGAHSREIDPLQTMLAIYAYGLNIEFLLAATEAYNIVLPLCHSAAAAASTTAAGS